MTLTPIVALHVTVAISATALGPVVLWTRLGRLIRPRLHRLLGSVWVALMLITAVSAVFIRSSGSFSWIHLLVPFVLGMLVLAFWFLRRKNVRGHKKTMLGLYTGACLIAGGFTLLPGRLLGDWLWGV